MAFTAVATVMVALTRVPVLVGGLVLVIGILIASFRSPLRIWRSVVYGGAAGIIVAVAFAVGYAEIRYGLIRKRDPAGRQCVVLPFGSDVYFGSPAEPILNEAWPFIVQLGGLAGGALGYAGFGSNRRP
jgi:hypothetical protein